MHWTGNYKNSKVWKHLFTKKKRRKLRVVKGWKKKKIGLLQGYYNDNMVRIVIGRTPRDTYIYFNDKLVKTIKRLELIIDAGSIENYINIKYFINPNRKI